MDEQAIISLSIEGTKLLLRGSKELLAGLVALIKYSADKAIPARKCREFLTSTNNVRFLSMNDENIQRFRIAAKPFGLKYLHIHDSDGDGLSTIMVRGEDAAVINRLIERHKLAVLTDVTQEEIKENPERAADVNEPIAEIDIGKDGITVEEAAKASRVSAQSLMPDAAEENPTTGQTAEKDGRLSGRGLKPSERTPQERDALWNDVSASIEKDFEAVVEEKRQHRLSLYNQDDPLIGKSGGAGKESAAERPSMKKVLEQNKSDTRAAKQQRVAEAAKKLPPAKAAVRKIPQR